MSDTPASYEQWIRCFDAVYSSVNQLSEIRCPNCAENALNLVFIIYGSDEHEGHGAFWCDACLAGLALGPTSVPADGLTVRLEEADIPQFRIVQPPGRAEPLSEPQPRQPLESGTLVSASVVEHHRWGVVVHLLPPAQDVIGVIDVLSVTNERPFRPFDDYPPIGSQVQAVVMGYTPHGQLRLSTRSSDIDPVLEAEEPNE